MADWGLRIERAGGKLREAARALDGDTGDGCYESSFLKWHDRTSRVLVRNPVASLVRRSAPSGRVRLWLYGAGFDVDEMTPAGQPLIDPHLRPKKSQA